MSANLKGGGKKGSKKDGVGGGWVCAHCKKSGKIGTMKRCGRCRLACYCSVECQKLHWKSGGHKKVCGREGSDCNEGVLGASGGGETALKHPCPICLDNEDDAGNTGVCFSCGQLFCGSCFDGLEERRVTSCPTCRAALFISQTEQVRGLRQLLARPTGRHTLVAQTLLGTFYASGTGVVQDAAEAMRWYRLAADQGFMNAEFSIGVCYTKGTGVAQDAAEAVRWYRLAADQGGADAQYTIGRCYANGTGVAQDYVEAVRWYRLAADQGDAGAQFNLGRCYANGTGLATNAAEAVRWYRLAADRGSAGAQLNLGMHYFKGEGVDQDAAEAVRWYRLAADQGNAAAQFNVGICYTSGTGVAQDLSEAVRWTRLAADQGHADAHTLIADLADPRNYRLK